MDTLKTFYAGKDYNFFIFGKENDAESDSNEVIRVVKYSKNRERPGQASVYGANTTSPFRSGMARCAESNGCLYIHTCHRMYTSKNDGIRHQANMTLAIKESDMTISDRRSNVGMSGRGLRERPKTIIRARNPADWRRHQQDMQQHKTVQITTGVDTSRPALVATGMDGGYIMWNTKESAMVDIGGFSMLQIAQTDNLYYAAYTADGTVGPIQTAIAPLSGCRPIYYNGRVVWYVTETKKDTPYMLDTITFYTLDASGVSSVIVPVQYIHSHAIFLIPLQTALPDNL